MLRIAFGPNRDPERKELAVSKGAPAIAKSSPFAESTFVIRINVPMLQNLGDDKALAGCFTSAIFNYLHNIYSWSRLFYCYNCNMES